jgi:hypothetical protein
MSIPNGQVVPIPFEPGLPMLAVLYLDFNSFVSIPFEPGLLARIFDHG